MIPPYVNAAMKFVLRSPVHGMVSQTVLLFTFTGRKTGKVFTTPVSYSRDGDQVCRPLPGAHLGAHPSLPRCSPRNAPAAQIRIRYFVAQ
jgi:hypothetical protein